MVNKKNIKDNNNLEKVIYYGLIDTEMGWVGIAGDEDGLLRTILPERNPENILEELGIYFHSGEKFEREEKFFTPLIEKVKDYFAGKRVEFNEEKTNLSAYTDFQRKVLLIGKEIPYGQTRTYRWLAEQSGYPRAYRAVGGVMAINPLPLIIPCHRVIGSNGQLTGFSSQGGLELKRKMLILEGVHVRSRK